MPFARFGRLHRDRLGVEQGLHTVARPPAARSQGSDVRAAHNRRLMTHKRHPYATPAGAAQRRTSQSRGKSNACSSTIPRAAWLRANRAADAAGKGQRTHIPPTRGSRPFLTSPRPSLSHQLRSARSVRSVDATGRSPSCASHHGKERGVCSLGCCRPSARVKLTPLFVQLAHSAVWGSPNALLPETVL
ncbi:hypothetical protein FKP32DRAFT_859940 [Trametes sanguinea]|nr:hypothetical protein FKP32DRAFT_859940 [Trametes sanguinea]